MLIETQTFQLGPYTVHHRQEPGPECAMYHIYLGTVKIGACISMPDLDCAIWVERQQRQQTGFAYSITPHRWEQRRAIKRSKRGR
jgi:hypothetical protein